MGANRASRAATTVIAVVADKPEAKENVPRRSFPAAGKGTNVLITRRLKSKEPNAAPAAVAPSNRAGTTAALRRGVKKSAPKNPTISNNRDFAPTKINYIRVDETEMSGLTWDF